MAWTWGGKSMQPLASQCVVSASLSGGPNHCDMSTCVETDLLSPLNSRLHQIGTDAHYVTRATKFFTPARFARDGMPVVPRSRFGLVCVSLLPP
jgi:hypothetical protein